jgi:hypothetical protein
MGEIKEITFWNIPNSYIFDKKLKLLAEDGYILVDSEGIGLTSIKLKLRKRTEKEISFLKSTTEEIIKSTKERYPIAKDNLIEKYRIVEFKCIKDFYMNSGEKAFIKDKTYIAKKYIDNNEYLFINESGEKHWINPNIDGMDIYFVKVK